MSQEIIRRRIRVYGWVQGVGFRYRAVTMEVQGTEEQIDRVILAVENGAYIRIENMESKTIPVDPGERRFTTKY